MEHNNFDRLGSILKASRKAKGLTREQLAEIISITPRYLMSIENENKKPSYDVLFRLVRELSISADTIFYPEQESSGSELKQLSKLLCLCDEYEIKIVKATLNALLESRISKNI
ncbi:MAG: helix-turn-helix transcriptional regulator [Thermincola sp.]|jgi:transcriptional regulator with XRE-family HTH domain|nr:helix-turn-helix transcriptional regulator [Thermincola sp.]MDT3705034.1 helix-turn-helix transcriptional regulator [Thermincola sp.]